MTTVSRARFAVLAATLLATACTVQQTDLPPLAGPSEFALSVRVTATPDSMNQDGVSQSTVVVSANGPDGAPLRGVPFRMDTAVGGVLADFGTLSARHVVTGTDGRATTTYTAPLPPHPAGSPVNVVTILAVPTGSNYQGAVVHTADIRLTTPGVILPPAGTPTPNFTFSPAEPSMNVPVFFDASTSCAETTECQSTAGIVSFTWRFGDGSQGTGERVTHSYSEPGTYIVMLTIANSRGLSASTSLEVTIGAGTPPTASFVFSPTPPQVGEPVSFNGDASRAAAGRQIVRWTWHWGDGTPVRSGSNLSRPTHTFDAPGTYAVVLTVRDDIGQEGTATQSVTVGSDPSPGAPTAAFVFSPTNPEPGQTIVFDASTSTTAQNQTIKNYRWVFGDGTTANTSSKTFTKVGGYPTAQTYSVTLTVTDSAGRTDTTSQTVSVGEEEEEEDDEDP